MHLQKLAQKHFRTLFLKINVLNSPFLVTKLSIQVLPCVMIFIDGVSKDRIVGFEGLPGGDNFTTEALEWRLAEAGVLQVERSTLKKDVKNPDSDEE
ncbi:thioredoxin-like protein, partial [Atractiella rhizophila]